MQTRYWQALHLHLGDNYNFEIPTTVSDPDDRSGPYSVNSQCIKQKLYSSDVRPDAYSSIRLGFFGRKTLGLRWVIRQAYLCLPWFSAFTNGSHFYLIVTFAVTNAQSGTRKIRAKSRTTMRNLLTSLYWKIGAGEGIRTLDPNLGKVVLYHWATPASHRGA